MSGGIVYANEVKPVSGKSVSVRNLNVTNDLSCTGEIRGGVPVGTIVAWVPGYFTDGSNGGYTECGSGIVALPDWWQECDGAEHTDTDSPIFSVAGRYLPNLTDDRFLMGKTTQGNTGGANDGHFHGMGTGADLNITASGNHRHSISDGSNLSNSHSYTATTITYVGVTMYTNYATHTHSSGDFAGRIGLVTGGFDGNAVGSNLPKYLSCKYIIRVK